MDTFELKGVPGSFRIIRREWSGYDRPDYTTMAKLTDDEAAALTKCRYLSEPYQDSEKPVAEIEIDPTTLLSVQLIDLTPWMITSRDIVTCLDIEVDQFYANCGPGVDPIPMKRERLVLTLPALTEPFQRKLTKLVDPWWFHDHPDARQQKWLDRFRPKRPPEPWYYPPIPALEQEWPDNPAEAVDGW